MKQKNLFDIKEGRKERDQGMSLALNHLDRDWNQQAEAWILGLAHGKEFTVDDLILAIGLPRKSLANRNNAVGACINAFAQRGLIVNTNRNVQSKRVVSHARRIFVWRRTNIFN